LSDLFSLCSCRLFTYNGAGGEVRDERKSCGSRSAGGQELRMNIKSVRFFSVVADMVVVEEKQEHSSAQAHAMGRRNSNCGLTVTR
jgi:hypothetical protein